MKRERLLDKFVKRLIHEGHVPVVERRPGVVGIDARDLTNYLAGLGPDSSDGDLVREILAT